MMTRRVTFAIVLAVAGSTTFAAHPHGRWFKAASSDLPLYTGPLPGIVQPTAGGTQSTSQGDTNLGGSVSLNGGSFTGSGTDVMIINGGAFGVTGGTINVSNMPGTVLNGNVTIISNLTLTPPPSSDPQDGNSTSNSNVVLAGGTLNLGGSTSNMPPSTIGNLTLSGPVLMPPATGQVQFVAGDVAISPTAITAPTSNAISVLVPYTGTLTINGNAVSVFASSADVQSVDIPAPQGGTLTVSPGTLVFDTPISDASGNQTLVPITIAFDSMPASLVSVFNLSGGAVVIGGNVQTIDVAALPAFINSVGESSLQAQAVPQSVPEPGTMGLLAVGATLLLKRRGSR